MKYRYFLFILFSCIVYTNVYGQHYYFRHYQVEDGLSHNSITCTLQDEEGFLWIGTKDGLNRFDGYTFKVFRNDPEDSTSIGGDFIQSLYEEKGNLWVGTNNGLYQYNARTENFIFVQGTQNRHIKDVTTDGNGNLWFIAGFSIAKYNEQKDVLKYYDIRQYLSATSMCRTKDGNVWFSSISGTIARYDSINDNFIHYDVFENSPETSSRWVERVYTASESTILVGTQTQGVKSFDLNTYTYKDILTKDPDGAEIFVRDFLAKSKDEYWIATESGVYIYNTANKKQINLRKNNNNPYSISDNAVYTLSADREGGVWAGTYFGGLNYYTKQYTPFDKFFPIGNKNSISGNAVREIIKDKNGNFWIGTEDAGLNKYDPSTGLFTHYKPDGKDGSLSYHNIHGLLADGDKLWIGTFEHGLDVMDINTGKVIKHYSAGDYKGQMLSNFVHTLHKTQTGQILAGTSVGLYSYNPQSDDFSVMPGFPYHHFTYIFDDHQGRIWAGTLRDGLFCYNPSTGKTEHFNHDLSNKNSLISNYITSIFEDSNNNIWISTEGGLCKFIPETNEFKRYSTTNGLPSNVTYRLLEDDNKNLWISTSKGLVLFDPESEGIKIFSKANGLLSDQFNYNSAYKDEDGQMYFGSVKGMISFNPDHFINNDYIPPIHITGFQVHNKELSVNKEGSPLQQSITYTDNIVLNHNQSSFSIDFAALSFTAPHMAEYAFRMEGLDNSWTYLKSNRKAYFTDLKPGDYIFKVKASNSSGVWNEEAAQLKITILPPFWASSWAYLLYTSLGLTLLFYGVRNYHRQSEAKNKRKIKLLENEKEKEIYQAKIEFFTNVAHEIRTPLTLIKGPLEKIWKVPIEEPVITQNLQVIEKNTQRLLNLTNQLLDFRKTEAKGFSLTFTKANISGLLAEICSMFKTIAGEKNLQIINDIPPQPVNAYVDREALTKIITNLVNNAVKYAEKTLVVQLKPTPDNKHVIISIKNDGPHIPVEMKEKIFEPFFRLNEADGETGSGIGLSLARSLTELHNGQLKLDNTADDMNTFVLTLPVHQKNEFKFYNEDEKDALQEEPEVAENNDGKPVLLLVEDNRELLQFVADEFHNDYQVVTAINGAEAMDKLEEYNVQLVVSDVVMPVMDGFELCHKIKTTIDYSHIPIILLTAKNTMQAKIEGLENGADAYIEKPFSPDHLQVQAANLLSNRNKIKEYFSSSPLTHIRSIASSKADEQFLKKLDEAIHENISHTELSVDLLADIMNMSRPTLYRKIKAISDLTPNELINIARLKKAAELLSQGNHKIYEVATIVGYNSQTSFGRNFQKQFGMTPSEYAKEGLEKQVEE